MGEYVSNIVNTLRTEKRITQEELAEQIGVSRQTVIAIEKGNYTPSVFLALKISKYFGKPVEKIFLMKYDE